MDKAEKAVYGLLIRTKDERPMYGDDHTMTVILNVVVVKGNKITNPSSLDSDPYQDLEVRGYVMEKYRNVDADAAFYDCYKVDSRDAKRMAKVFTKLNTGLEKLDDKLGRAISFGSQVARIANVLGIEHIIQCDGDNKGSSYSDNSYRFYQVGYGVSVLDNIIHAWREKHPLPVEERQIA